MCQIPQLVKRAKELSMQSLAVTDHGVMYGAIQFYTAAKQAGIKPIIGCEVYIAPESRLSRGAGEKNNYHLVLLAKNLTGYHNLIQLTSKAHLEGFYYRPRVDKELLKQHSAGLVALSACVAGEVPNLVLQGRLEEARQAARWYKAVFGDFYFEIQRHPMPELEQINKELIPMGAELGIPLVATNDVHYIRQEDAPAHDLLLCIGTNATVHDEKRVKMSGPYFYLKSQQEMADIYRDLPQSLANTEQIAAMCDLNLEFGRLHLPEIELPAGKTADEYLAALCYEGLPRYYANPGEEIKQRLAYELDVIEKTQFANYFLVVWDIISFTRKNGIHFGVRGSAAASLVLRCLGITEVDPIKNRLVFERFLNIERREMPDIDLDFEDARREEVISYVTHRYGADHVAQIITFGTLGARAAIRDVGRALGMSYADVDRVARLVPFAPGMTLDRALDENNELKNIYQEDETIRNLIDSARRVEGISRHASTHAAGVVISKEPLTNHVPLQRVSRGNGNGNESGVMTQFTMEDIARVGLLKMDFLGLANLTILGKAVEIIRETRGKQIDIHRLPMDDSKAFKLLASGETAGVFQLEGAGMRRFIKQLKPTVFSDIAAMVALYRPGPMEHIPTFIDAKHGRKAVTYIHPALEKILKETYGVIVFQEQVLFIVQELAGYSLGQADIFRKAMGKKIAEVMQKEKQHFLAGARERGFPDEIANQVFALIEPFAGYAFNKAHAFSYALIAYQTAYLKANFPAEYMTALLNAYSDQPEKIAGAVAECRRLNIPVLPPDINRSLATFAIEKSEGKAAVRFGLVPIKNVGAGAIEPIILERAKAGEFKSITDFCRRCDLRGTNKRVMESLIKAGVFDSFGDRGVLLGSLNSILSLAQREQRLRETGQATMFDLFGAASPLPVPELTFEGSAASEREKFAWERELLGVALSRQPFMSDKPEEGASFCADISVDKAGERHTVIGMVVAATPSFTRMNKPFVTATIEDISGTLEVIAWSEVYEKDKELWQEGTMVRVEGKIKERDGRAQLYCDTAIRYRPPAKPAPIIDTAVPEEGDIARIDIPPAKLPRLVINIHQSDDAVRDKERLHQIIDTLKAFPGNETVGLCINSPDSITNLTLPDITVDYCEDLYNRLTALLGEAAVIRENFGVNDA